MNRRALHRHLVVGVVTVAIVGVAMVVTELSKETWGNPDDRKTDGSLWQLNVATGTAALTLLVTTLAYRPVRVLRGRPPGPAHLPWRRTMGIWAAVALLVHVPGGVAIHTTGWRFWTPFESVVPGVAGRRLDEFTLGFWAGLFALLVLLPLVLTSNDASLRRLGAVRWQILHRRGSWIAYWLVAIHVVALQYGEFRNRRHVAVTATVFAVALAARLAVRARARRARGAVLLGRGSAT